MTSRFLNSSVGDALHGGAIGVMPTDTIYGIVGSALDKKAVEKIYRLRRRDPKKPMIILINSLDDLELFAISLRPKEKATLRKLWPGKVSVILQCRSRKFAYLHRGKGTLAFRVPRPSWLRNLLKKSGPLVAPSANFEGKPPSKSIKEARKYFGDKVDFYGDAGRLNSLPSTLIELKEGKIRVIREGAGRVR